jgi:hypothetical protein
MLYLLDIDLDFFLSDVKHGAAPDGHRAKPEDYWPDQESRVRDFMEQCCMLSKQRKVPGFLRSRHHEVFDDLARLAQQSPEHLPFELVHVDAHADLGLGNRVGYVLCDLLSVPVERRAAQDVSQHICEGNWLLFAIANRWVRRLVYVHHPTTEGDDIHGLIWRRDENAICLPRYDREEYDSYCWAAGFQPKVIEFEPPVPIEIVGGDAFKAKTAFDYVFLSRSPEYTPAESDNLIPIIGEYISFKQEAG